jgi:hypothetical protein
MFYMPGPDYYLSHWRLPPMKSDEWKIAEEMSSWLDRLLQRDGISLDCDRTDSTPTGEDEMNYTINLIDRAYKILHPKKTK